MPIQLPMHLEDGNWLIKAKLVDRYIKSINGTIRGRIYFKIDDADVLSMFYTNKEQFNRLLVGETSCSLFSYSTSGWNLYLKALSNKGFLNHLLYVGPSVILRIPEYSYAWKTAEDEVIRGVKEHAAKVTLDRDLDVWFYFKDDDYEAGLTKPNKVKFLGYDARIAYEPNGMYWFDIYMNARVEQNFDTIVTPKPTIYCQQSAIDSLGYPNEPFPRITEHSIHFISKTKSFNAGPSKREEVYADERYQILSIKSSTGGDNKTETIYNYQLGLVYEMTEDGNCSVSPMKLSAPGLVQDSSLSYDIFKLDLNRLLNFHLNYRYYGPALFDERNGIGTHAWQISEEKAKVEEKTYPYVVTTQYFNKLTDMSSGYTLVGTIISAYDIEVSNVRRGCSNLQLLESLSLKPNWKKSKERFLIIKSMINSSESTRKFNVQNCYPDPASRKTIAMYFTCKDIPCDYFDQYYYQFQDKVKESLVNSGTIAASRIASIVPIFNSDEIIIYITILDFPRIKDAFEMRNMKLDEKTLTKASKVIIDGNEEDCLMKNSYRYEPFDEQSLIDQQKNNAITRSTHIGTIFGSIVLFAAAGLIFGALVAIVTTKFYYSKKNDPSDSYNRHTFSWDKQLNED
uniref:Uncharacterized protein n=1 Tax=Tetranychus urticae TaxID=32264 RepID=T1KVC0_TETUR